MFQIDVKRRSIRQITQFGFRARQYTRLAISLNNRGLAEHMINNFDLVDFDVIGNLRRDLYFCFVDNIGDLVSSVVVKRSDSQIRD